MSCIWWFFFFSSRRRHTRSYGDWSSDVCSSDLTGSRRGIEWPAAINHPETPPKPAIRNHDSSGKPEIHAVARPDGGGKATVADGRGDFGARSPPGTEGDSAI